MESREEIIAKLKELKPMPIRDYAVKKIGLFGSFSQNQQTGSSDIDLLVELERPIGWKFFSLELYLERIFQRKIDLVNENALRAQLKDHILKQVSYI